MGATAMQTRDEDWVEKVVTTTTRQSLLLFTTSGKAYWLKVYDIPEAGRQAKGYLVSRLVQLAEDERVTAMIPVSLDAEGDLFFVTKNGICKRTPLSEFSNVRRSGLRALTLKPGDSLIQVKRVTDGDEMLIATADGKTIRFAVEDVRAMGREAAGVIGIRLREGDTVVGADSTVRGGLVLLVSLLGYGKVTPLEEFPLHKRGGGGVIALKVSEKSGPLSVMRIVHKEDEMLLMTAEGIAIRTQVSEIKELHRASLGVRVMRIEPPDRLSACSVFEVDDDQG